MMFEELVRPANAALHSLTNRFQDTLMNPMLVRSFFAIALSLALTSTDALAQAYHFEAILNGEGVNPPSSSAASGRMRIRINQLETILHIDVQYSGLESAPTEYHFGSSTQHGITSESWPGKFPVTFRLGGSGLGIADDEVDMVANPLIWADPFLNENGGTAAGAAAKFVSGLRAGAISFDIHSASGPMIGGHFVAIPEPGTAVLISVGSLAACFCRRRGRR